MRMRLRRCWLGNALLAGLLASVLGHALEPGVGLREGDTFPAFTLQRADGTSFDFGALAGRPKVVLFWATWCPYCRKLMPAIVRLHEDFAAQGLAVVGVNFRDDDGDTRAYAHSMGIEFDIVLKGDALAARAGVRGTPTVFVLDAANRIVLRSSNSDPADLDIRRAVESTLGPLPATTDPRVGVFRADFPYESRYTVIEGHRLHYVDEGEGRTFVFLHGNPTSMYLWRNVMRYVQPHGRILAVDNIGFGLSDKPDIDYTYQTHSRFIDAFLDAHAPDGMILVVHDWGSVLGLDYARRHPERVAGVVFMEALIPPAFPMRDLGPLGGSEGLFAKFRTPEVGKILLIEQNVFIEQLLGNAPLTRRLNDIEFDTYREPFRDPQSRLPIYVWPNELPIAGEPARNVAVVESIGQWLSSSPIPKLLQYASPGTLVSPEAAAWMAENYRELETQFVGYGGHYLQEDNPEAIGRGIVDWARRSFSTQSGR